MRAPVRTMFMNEAAVVKLDGEWDIYRRDELAALFEDARTKEYLVIDFSSCRYADSTVLSGLVTLRNYRNKHGHPPARLVVSTTAVRRLLSISGLDEVFRVFETIDEAANDLLFAEPSPTLGPVLEKVIAIHAVEARRNGIPKQDLSA